MVAAAAAAAAAVAVAVAAAAVAAGQVEWWTCSSLVGETRPSTRWILVNAKCWALWPGRAGILSCHEYTSCNPSPQQLHSAALRAARGG